MLKFRSNVALPFFLITAFLAAQFSVSHIHLAEHHNHDGNHHQHDIQAHAHYAPITHADTLDPAHAKNDHNVVELDNYCTSPGWGQLSDLLTASASIAYHLLFLPNPSVIQLPEEDGSKQQYIAYSTIRLRAPPQFS